MKKYKVQFERLGLLETVVIEARSKAQATATVKNIFSAYGKRVTAHLLTEEEAEKLIAELNHFKTAGQAQRQLEAMTA